MTQDEKKATRYNELIRLADVTQRELSKLKSQNAGINTTSKDYDKKLAQLNNQMAIYEAEMKKLFIR
jgi:hypothetical protein